MRDQEPGVSGRLFPQITNGRDGIYPALAVVGRCVQPTPHETFGPCRTVPDWRSDVVREVNEAEAQNVERSCTDRPVTCHKASDSGFRTVSHLHDVAWSLEPQTSFRLQGPILQVQ